MIKHKPVNSTWIASVGFDPNGGILEITTTAGKTSVHRGVPALTYDSFMASHSKGAFFHAHISKQYRGVTK